MPELWGVRYERGELLRRVGRVEQVAGVRLLTLGDGGGRGVRILEFRTGSGFEFDVLVDRGFDVAGASTAVELWADSLRSASRDPGSTSPKASAGCAASAAGS